jgi:drug/metabolite transporter (DMT)-like permease
MKRGLFASDGSTVLLPLDVAAVRITTAALLLLPISIRAISQVKKRDYPFLAVVGLAGSAIPAFCFATAQQKLNSGAAGMLNSLTPFFTFVIGLLVFKQKASRFQIAGIIIAMCGTFILVDAYAALGTSRWNNAGLLILATFLYGVSVNTIAQKLKHVEPLHITSISLLMAAIPFTIILITGDINQRIGGHPEGRSALNYIFLLGGIGTGLANYIYFRLTQSAGPLYASSVTYLIPIVALLWATADGEPLGLPQSLAAILIISGIWLLRQHVPTPK